MSANGLYDPDQSAVNTRWVEPWSEAFRVSCGCLCCVVWCVLASPRHARTGLHHHDQSTRLTYSAQESWPWMVTVADCANRHNAMLDSAYPSISRQRQESR
jgi:hypothetical protein